jgi:hypothetical protein
MGARLKRIKRLQHGALACLSIERNKTQYGLFPAINSAENSPY